MRREQTFYIFINYDFGRKFNIEDLQFNICHPESLSIILPPPACSWSKRPIAVPATFGANNKRGESLAKKKSGAEFHPQLQLCTNTVFVSQWTQDDTRMFFRLFPHLTIDIEYRLDSVYKACGSDLLEIFYLFVPLDQQSEHSQPRRNDSRMFSTPKPPILPHLPSSPP